MGPAIFYFEDDDERPPLRGQVLAVNSYQLHELTWERLRLSNGGTVEGYIDILRQHYPLMPSDASVDVVDFTLR